MKTPNITNLQNILKYKNYFENQENEFYSVKTEMSLIDPYIYTKETSNFINDLYHENFIQPFDWAEFQKNNRKFFENPDMLQEANIITLKKILTTIIRGDRFNSGFLAHYIDNNYLLNIIIRLNEIYEEILDRVYGCLLGLAIGDALGAPVEFKEPGTFKPVDDFRESLVHGLNPGEWTDDTSMALCLAESLIECGKFDPYDQMKRYLRWYHDGHLSITGNCFDIGNTTREALECFEKTQNPYCGPENEYSAGNGSLMRVAPIPLFFFSDIDDTLNYAALSSRTTHQHPLAVQCCQYLAGLIHGALKGENKEKLLSSDYLEIENCHDELKEVISGSYKIKNPPEIRGRGYVVKSLEAVLWAFYNSDNFKDGCLLAVNLGEDSDTTGAIYGQLAGAYYGKSNISSHWINNLAWKDIIINMGHELVYSNRNKTD